VYETERKVIIKFVNNRENMSDYIILGIFILISLIAVYFAFKSRDKKTPETNCDDEPIDYLLK
jgi:uncharacterized membrane protein (DUF373 family)